MREKRLDLKCGGREIRFKMRGLHAFSSRDLNMQKNSRITCPFALYFDMALLLEGSRECISFRKFHA